MKTKLLTTVAAIGLAAVALAIAPGAAQAGTINGTISTSSLNVTSSGNLAYGDTITNSNNFFGSGTGNLSGFSGTPLSTITLTASDGSTVSWTSSLGDFSGTVQSVAVAPNGSNSSILQAYVLGTFTPANPGPLSTFSAGSMSESFAFTQTTNQSGTSFSGGSTLASPPATNTVPEPASLALLGSGLVGLGLARRRKKASAS